MRTIEEIFVFLKNLYPEKKLQKWHIHTGLFNELRRISIGNYTSNVLKLDFTENSIYIAQDVNFIKIKSFLQISSYRYDCPGGGWHRFILTDGDLLEFRMMYCS